MVLKSINLRRICAYLFDLIFISMIASCLSFLPFLANSQKNYQNSLDELYELHEAYTRNEITEQDYELQYIPLSYQLNRDNMSYTILNVALILAYFGVFQWQMRGQTLGKKMLKIRVRAVDASKEVGFFSYFFRAVILNNVVVTLCQLGVIGFMTADRYYTIYQNINLVGYILLYIIVFFVLIRSDSRGLHDLCCGTIVVQENEGNVSKEETVIIAKKNTKSNK